MVKSFKYRLRPTKKQEQILLTHIDECRILYNQLLCARIQAWKNENKSLSQYDQTKTIPLLKQQHAAFKQVYSQVLQQVSQRVDLAFKGFFRRLKDKSKTGEKAGFPRYKSQGRYDSITYPQFVNGCRLDDKGLRLGSIGCIRIVQHRPLEGIPKSCTITRTATGKKKLVLDSKPSSLTIRHKIARHADIERKRHSQIVCIIARRVAIRRTETTMLR